MRVIKKANAGNNRNLVRTEETNGRPASSEHATRAWGNFHDRNQLLLEKLLTEQFGLCCYTELNLADLKETHGLGSHFEHEQPKNLYPQRTFDELNLLLCVLDSQDLQRYRYAQQFGGHYKDHRRNTINYDPNKFISPQSSNCADYFVYISIDGSIAPNVNLSDAELDKAIYTIDLLNLNAPFLKAERERWLQELNEILKPFIDGNDIASIGHIAECELTLTDRLHPDLIHDTPFPQLKSFHSATRAIFGAVGERVIHAHCPHID